VAELNLAVQLKRRAKTSGVLRDKSGGWALAH
jgi:hypothetical protein